MYLLTWQCSCGSKRVKYLNLYSALSWSASNALPLPVSRHWYPQANPTARHSAKTARPRIQVGISRDMPVYSPAYAGYSFSRGRLRLSKPGCLALCRGGLPLRSIGTNCLLHCGHLTVSANSEGRLRLSKPGCLVLCRGGLPLRSFGTNCLLHCGRRTVSANSEGSWKRFCLSRTTRLHSFSAHFMSHQVINVCYYSFNFWRLFSDCQVTMCLADCWVHNIGSLDDLTCWLEWCTIFEFHSRSLVYVYGSLHPEYDQAMNNLGNLYKDRGQLVEAEQLLSQAVSIRY